MLGGNSSKSKNQGIHPFDDIESCNHGNIQRGTDSFDIGLRGGTKKILILDKEQAIGKVVKPMLDSITYSGGEKKFEVTVKAIDPSQKLNIATYQQALLREEYVGMIIIPADVYTSKKWSITVNMWGMLESLKR